MRVHNSETKYHQLIANRNGLRLDSYDGNTTFTLWQAALKSDLGNPGSCKIIEIDVSDLNNPPKAYILETQPSVNIPGYPAGLDGNRVLVLQLYPGSLSYSAQLAIGFGCDKLAIRRKSGSVSWTDWKYFIAA